VWHGTLHGFICSRSRTNCSCPVSCPEHRSTTKHFAHRCPELYMLLSRASKYNETLQGFNCSFVEVQVWKCLPLVSASKYHETLRTFTRSCTEVQIWLRPMSISSKIAKRFEGSFIRPSRSGSGSACRCPERRSTTKHLAQSRSGSGSAAVRAPAARDRREHLPRRPVQRHHPLHLGAGRQLLHGRHVSTQLLHLLRHERALPSDVLFAVQSPDERHQCAGITTINC